MTLTMGRFPSWVNTLGGGCSGGTVTLCTQESRHVWLPFSFGLRCAVSVSWTSFSRAMETPGRRCFVRDDALIPLQVDQELTPDKREKGLREVYPSFFWGLRVLSYPCQCVLLVVPKFMFDQHVLRANSIRLPLSCPRGSGVVGGPGARVRKSEPAERSGGGVAGDLPGQVCVVPSNAVGSGNMLMQPTDFFVNSTEALRSFVPFSDLSTHLTAQTGQKARFTRHAVCEDPSALDFSPLREDKAFLLRCASRPAALAHGSPGGHWASVAEWRSGGSAQQVATFSPSNGGARVFVYSSAVWDSLPERMQGQTKESPFLWPFCVAR